jgi:hypothetical protein
VASQAQDTHAFAIFSNKNEYNFVNVSNFVLDYSLSAEGGKNGGASVVNNFTYKEGNFFPNVRGDLWTAEEQAKQWAGWNNQQCRLQMQQHMWSRFRPDVVTMKEAHLERIGLDDKHADTTLVIHIRSGDLFGFDYFNGNELKPWMPAAKEGKEHEDGFYWQVS